MATAKKRMPKPVSAPPDIDTKKMPGKKAVPAKKATGSTPRADMAARMAALRARRGKK